MLEVTGVEEKVCECKKNTVEIDRKRYEELLGLESRIGVLVELIRLDGYVNVTQMLTIIGTIDAQEVIEVLQEKERKREEERRAAANERNQNP